MKRPFLPYTDRRLHTAAQPVEAVTESVRMIWDDMVDTMEAMPGVGLAAPQLGVLQRMFVMDCSKDPDRSAALYERELQAFYGADTLDDARPLFDLVLMGAGPDGHTASLFPGYPAVEETSRWVVGVPRANVEPFVPRVTLTLPTLASCGVMLFEVAGKSKRAILTRLLAGENLPANRARSIGDTVWLVDRDALPEGFGG